MKLKEFLSSLKTQIKPEPALTYERIIAEVKPKQKVKKRISPKWIAGAVAAVLLITGIGIYTYHYFKFDTSYNITGDVKELSKIVYVQANSFSHQGITPNSTVKIVTKESMSTRELEKHLSVSPAVPYSITKKGTNRFLLSFDEALKENASYTISSKIDNATVFRWSLQTESSFGIDNTFPKKNSFDIDCSTAINITFSESGVNAFQEYFSIYPAVEGTYTHKGRVWTFKPKAPLKPYSTYTVTINGEIAGNEEIPLKQDYVFSFTTGANDGQYAYIVNNTFDIAARFSTAQAPSVTVCAQSINSSTADMTVYKLHDAQTYLSLHQKYAHNTVLSASIIDDVKQAENSIYSQFSVSAIPDPEKSGTYYFNYPKELENGYYLTEISWNGLKLYQLLQSNDLAAYVASTGDKFSVWVNNAQTKQPVAEAKIKFEGTSAKTNTKGLAMVDAKLEGQNHTYITIESESLLPLILCCQTTETEINEAGKYNVYLCTDNTAYQSDGIVKLWGHISKRFDNVTTPDATIQFNNESHKIKLESNGAFELELSLDGIEPGAYDIDLIINNQKCHSKEITVKNNELSSYNLSVSSDKNAYFDGENATFTIKAEYADRNPVAKLNMITNDQLIETNRNGIVTQTAPISYASGANINPLSNCSPTVYLSKYTVDSEEFSAPVLVFKSDEHIDASVTDLKGNACTLTVHTKKIDLTKINALDQDTFVSIYRTLSSDEFLGENTAKDVTVEIHDVSFDRKQTGTYFDNKSNKIQLKYAYTEKDTVVKTVTIKTIDGIATVGDFPLPTANGYRYLKIITKDSKGNECFVKIYIDNKIDNNASDYKFKIPTTVVNEETVNISVYDPSAKQNLQEGSFIYHIDNGFEITTTATDKNTDSFIYSKEIGPSFTVSGAYFDGQNYHPILPSAIQHDQQAQKLDLTLTTDKTSYLPGEKATITVLVKNADGTPYKNSSVNLNLTTAPNTFSNNQLLDQLTNHTTQTIHTTLAFNSKDNAAEIEEDNYSDSVFFKSAETNGDGIATFEIPLPQIASEWTLTTQTIGQNAQSGFKQLRLYTNKEFGIIASISPEIKETDDTVVTYYFVGNDINDDSKIDTEITLYQGTEVKDVVSSQDDNTTTYLNLGKLSSGEYSIKITAKFNNKTTTNEMDFVVTNSTHSINSVSEISNATGKISHLLLADKDHPYYKELFCSLYSSNGLRVEQQLAYCFAENKVNHSSTDIKRLLKTYQVKNGYGFSATDAEPDLLLTAKIAALFPDEINAKKLGTYFDSILQNETSTYEEVLCAFWGKAALHEAVEKDLLYYYAEGNGLTSEQQLYFALAFAYTGNQAKAYEIYQNRIKTLLTENEGMVYLTPDDANRSELCNSLLSFLLNRISATESPQAMKYILATDSQTTLPNLAAISYIKEFVPMLSGNNVIEVGITDVGTKTIEYNKCSPSFVQIDADANNIAFKDNELSTTVTAIGTTDIGKIATKNQLPESIATFIPTDVILGDDVTIYISVNATQIKAGKLFVKIPYGLQYKDVTANSEIVTEIQNDVLIITLPKNVNSDIKLLCKAAMPGEFFFEPMVIPTDSEKYYANIATTVKIEDSKTSNIETYDYWDDYEDTYDQVSYE